MRIATAMVYERAIDVINERQTRLARAMDELGTGSKLLRPSDDPAAAAEAERLRAQQSREKLAQRMNGFAVSVLTQAESALGQVEDTMQALREQFVRAGNPTLSASDRASLAVQMRADRDELLRLANLGDPNGGYVFGGLGSRSAPFSSTAAHQAPAGEQKVGLDAEVPTSLDGQQVFLAVPTDSGPQSIFALLDGAIAALEDPAAGSADVAAAVKAGIDGLDGAMDRVLNKRAELGEHLKLLDSREALSEDVQLAIAARLSDLVDADYAKSASDVTRHQALLEAAMKSYASIGGRSLFDYI